MLYTMLDSAKLELKLPHHNAFRKVACSSTDFMGVLTVTFFCKFHTVLFVMFHCVFADIPESGALWVQMHGQIEFSC